jgi:predicted branched-subunit amino acid permease
MVQLFTDGVAWPVIVVTVLLINLRHLLIAVALRP